MPTIYEIYKNKAALCRSNAEKCETQWSRGFWKNRADILDGIAENLPVSFLQKQSTFNDSIRSTYEIIHK